jgi:hypothetical protein
MKGVLRSMSFAAFAAVFFLFVIVPAASAATIKVPSEYKTIQAAIDRAEPGDTIQVAPGNYTGDLTLKENMVLQGAGAKTTTITGTGKGSVIEGAKGAVIEGFTITGSGGKGTIGVTMDAAVSGNNAPMTIANNRITGNNTGIKLYYSPSNIINNEIAGSAVYGIYLIYSDSLVENNIIAKSGSHGIYNSYSDPEIINNTLAGNFTGIFSEISKVVVKNNIVANNTLAGIRWAEFPEGQYRAEPILSYNLVWGNGEDYINVEPGKGDVSKDPLFEDLKKDDFHLKNGSPAAKAGEGGTDLGAFGGQYAQASIPASPKEKSYAKLSLKERLETLKEPDYMTQTDWRKDPVSYGRGDFQGHCVPCHGPQGRGDGLLADTLDVRPRDLSDKAIMSTRTDEMLFKVIKDGGASMGFSESMMSFNIQFRDEEIMNVIQYIRAEICKCRYEGGK